MTSVAERHEPFVAAFESLKSGGQAGPDWVRAYRDTAMRQFAVHGFPTTKLEDWRFTNVGPIAGTAFVHDGPVPGAKDVEPHLFGAVEPFVAVVAAGRFAPDLSSLDGLPKGVIVSSLAQALARGSDAARAAFAKVAAGEHPFMWLNTALFADGVFVHVPKGVTVDRPLQIHVASDSGASPRATHPRLLIVADEDSRVSIVESYGGPDGRQYLTNTVTEVTVAPGAVVQHVKVQREGLAAFHIAGTFARLARGAVFASHNISLGGGLVRNDISAVLDGEGAEATLNGLYLADGDRLVDNHTSIDHAMPHCPSHELYKGVLGGKARAVFNGKIFVRQDAQKTNAKQTNKALLLSDDAQINTKPQLEIFADDVKCTHGAAIGQMDEDALFYLRARGIGVDEARRMLIRAFAGEVIGQVKPEGLHDRLEALMLEALPRG